MEFRGARAPKVPDVRVIDAEFVVDVVDKLGDEEIQIRVSLAMTVCWQIDWHSLEACLKVGAVVEVEAADEVLVCLALAGVLRHDESGDDLQQLAIAHDSSQSKVGDSHATFRGRVRDAAEVVDSSRHFYCVERETARRGCLCVRGDAGGKRGQQ